VIPLLIKATWQDKPGPPVHNDPWTPPPTCPKDAVLPVITYKNTV
jgi:hypothetical protein